MVLLARDTPPNHPAAKELGLDLALWQPLIMDRQFVDWLVKHPSDQVHPPFLPPGSAHRDQLAWVWSPTGCCLPDCDACSPRKSALC